MPGVVIASTDFVNSTPHESCEGSHSDAMKSRRGTCHVRCSTIHGGIIDNTSMHHSMFHTGDWGRGRGGGDGRGTHKTFFQ
jgi:hypothetical protein